MGYTCVRDGLRKDKTGSASFAGSTFIGPFDFTVCSSFAQGDGRRDSHELDVRAIGDGIGQPIDREGADDGLAIEGHVSIDEGGRLARKGRGEGLGLCIGPFDRGTFGPIAQGDGGRTFFGSPFRRVFRITSASRGAKRLGSA